MLGHAMNRIECLVTVGSHNLAVLMSASEIRYIGSDNGIGTSFGAHNSVGKVTLSSLSTDGIYSRLFCCVIEF